MIEPEPILFQDLFVSILTKEVIGGDYIAFNCQIGGGNHVGMEQHEDDLAIMNLEDAKIFHSRLGEMIKFIEDRK